MGGFSQHSDQDDTKIKGSDGTEIGNIEDKLKTLSYAQKLEIQRGKIPGMSIMEAFGEREDINTTTQGEDIWKGTAASIPIPAAAGEQMTLVSSNNNDRAAGTGVSSVLICYLDATGNEQTETVVINGTTTVNTVATNMRFIQSLHSTAVGTNGVASGNIIIYKTGAASTIYNMIELGGNMSLVNNRMVPLGKTLYLQSWSASEARDKRVMFRIRSTDFDGVINPGIFLFKDSVYIKKTASGDLPVKAVIPELSIVKITAWADQPDAEGSARWWGVLIDN